METTLKVDGMTCEMCMKHVTSALQNVPGVKVPIVGPDRIVTTNDAGETGPSTRC